MGARGASHTGRAGLFVARAAANLPRLVTIEKHCEPRIAYFEDRRTVFDRAGTGVEHGRILPRQRNGLRGDEHLTGSQNFRGGWRECSTIFVLAVGLVRAVGLKPLVAQARCRVFRALPLEQKLLRFLVARAHNHKKEGRAPGRAFSHHVRGKR